MQAKQLTNQNIVVLAVYAIGGADRYVDTEDIAIEAAKLAPGRFSWRKYKDQINIDTVRKRLDLAKKTTSVQVGGPDLQDQTIQQGVSSDDDGESDDFDEPEDDGEGEVN